MFQTNLTLIGGLGKTGTHSLAEALHILGIRVQHCARCESFDMAANGWVDSAAFAGNFLERQAEAGAKAIWLDRNLRDWLDSWKRHVNQHPNQSEAVLKTRTAVFGQAQFEEGAWAKAYYAHRNRCIALGAHTQFINEGWEPLCNFLGLAAPPLDFPQMNQAYSLGDWQLQAIEHGLKEHGCRRVLELGSGASTYMLERLAYQGSIDYSLSIEHEKERALQFQFADVRHLAIKDGFYDISALEAGEAFDAIIVDGPPCHDANGQTARYSTFEQCGHLLRQGAQVFIDDLHMPHVNAWALKLIDAGVIADTQLLARGRKKILTGTYLGE